MELAGIIGLGAPQEGIRPDLLRYIFVKGPETSETRTGNSTFWVFNNSHEITVPAAVPGKQHEAQVAVVPDDTRTEVSAAKQRTITDFFAPCSSASHGSGETRRAPSIPFITPHPSVHFSEVPVVFQEQRDCLAEDYIDPTHPLFEHDISEHSSEPSSIETSSSLAQVDVETPSTRPNATIMEEIDFKKRSRRYSTPAIFATWDDRMNSSSSDHETQLESPAQTCEWSFLDRPVMGHENLPFDGFSSPPGFAARDPSGTSLEADAETDTAEVDIEQYWIEKEEERLVVIRNMEKTMVEMKEMQENTAKAFQVAAKATQRLQAELEKNKSSLRQMENVMNDLLHNLDATDMHKEELEKEVANNRKDCKYQLDRAEESLTLVQDGPSQGTFSESIQAKAEAESRITIQKTEWASEKDSLESQLRQRCESVARLTKTLSRVADLDRWQEVQKELEELTKRAGRLPEDLKVALSECDMWKNRHDNIWQEYAQLCSEKAALQETLHEVEDFDTRCIRELKQKCKQRQTSERAFKECLKRAFERMVRCSLCLETEGYSAFDTEHRDICEKVSELTGEDYQEPLLNYYAERDIQSEFNFGDNVVVDDEEVVFDNRWARAGSEELDLRGNEPESTLDLSSAPTPGTTEEDSVTTSITQEQEDQESLVIQEARKEGEVIHTNESQTTAADEVFPAGPDPFHDPRDQDGNAPSNGGQGFGIFSSSAVSTTPSFNEVEDNKQDFWSNTSFATVGNNPFASNAASAAESEANTNHVPLVFKIFATSQPAELQTPASESSEVEQGTEVTEAPREATPITTEAAFSPPQPQEFSFGGNVNPAIFSGPSPSSSTADPNPPSNGIFSFGTQDTASVDVPAQEEAAEERGISEEDTSNIEALKKDSPLLEKGPKTDQPEENVLQNEYHRTPNPQTPPTSPNPPSPPQSRSQQKRAKRAQEKAIKKAETEARNATARERRRVQEVLMMRC